MYFRLIPCEEILFKDYFKKANQSSGRENTVFVKTLEDNLAVDYAQQLSFPTGSAFEIMTERADTTCFSPEPPSGATLSFAIKASGATNALHALDGEPLYAHPLTSGGMITGWALSGSLAQSIGLNGEE